MKLIRVEAESAALAAFIQAEIGPFATSRVGVVELRRVARRGDASVERADVLARSLEVIEVDKAVEEVAVGIAPELRALDAIHLASALISKERLRRFVCYDRGLAAAATAAGLPVLAPQ